MAKSKRNRSKGGRSSRGGRSGGRGGRGGGGGGKGGRNSNRGRMVAEQRQFEEEFNKKSPAALRRLYPDASPRTLRWVGGLLC